ncbi:hypothetical protein NQ318_010559 [Aromia moschata]|uniref:Lipase domain-containing protein n=1 Tax=Aromia moschata TaxID=1265417 RepID=A0AAV8XB53_9CUCU|nr:hypothetical protein NQ318_010559 [Aromia moschata]
MTVVVRKDFLRSLPPVDFNLADAVDMDIIYIYFKDPSEIGKLLTKETVSQEHLDKVIPTVLLLHGWARDEPSNLFVPFKNEIFKLGPHNIIYIDWSKGGTKSYTVSCANVKSLGKFITQFLIASEVPSENIHLIGHYLGAQLAGFVGKAMLEMKGKRVGRITGLDPAGPKFENTVVTADMRLSSKDADFVDVIHTDVQLYGYTAPIGHVDFYPDLRQHQPRCLRNKYGNSILKQTINRLSINHLFRWLADCLEVCNQDKAVLYFIESISKTSRAVEANFLLMSNSQMDIEVKVVVKDNAEEITFGYHVEKSARGIFYFETNSEKPFLK